MITVMDPPAPTITSLSSNSGCIGSTMTINGTNLIGATAANVTVGGTPVTSITSNTGTALTVVIGSGTTGTVSVTIGGNTATSTDTYTINARPTASASSNSPVCSGTSLNLNGAHGYGHKFYLVGTKCVFFNVRRPFNFECHLFIFTEHTLS